MAVLQLLLPVLILGAAAAGPVRDEEVERRWTRGVREEKPPLAPAGDSDGGSQPRNSTCRDAADASDTTQHLAALRAAMLERDLQVYYVPSGDDHQSEYVAEHDKRLRFVSGFSGSAGEALVTADAALLWTDSRYYLQAERQLDCNWQLMRAGQPEVPSIISWITTQLPEGTNVSADPKIVSDTLWNNWDNALAPFGINMVMIPENLIDPIWDELDRPAYPDVPITELEIEFTGESRESKLKRLRAALGEAGADAMVVTALDEVAWVLNLRGGEVPFTPVFRSYLAVGRDPDWATLYLPRDKHPQVAALLNDSIQLKPYEDVWDDLPRIRNVAKKVLLPAPFSYAGGVSRMVYKAVLSASNIISATSPLARMKDIKNDVEATGMKRAHVKDAVALCQLLFELEKGIPAGEKWDELKVEARLKELRYLQKDSMGPSFETIAAFAENSALPHYSPTTETNKIIDNSSVFMLDSGGQYKDGTTDVTRTIHLGSPTALHKKVYTNILRGCIDLVSTTFPEGETLQSLEILIRAPLYSIGLNYGHGSTHGIGSFLGVHEAFNTTYHPYFFGSQEPGYYRDDDFGMRLENIVMVVPANMSFEGNKFLKFEPVTLVPYERNLIDLNLISDKELIWLNNYHTRVQAEVGSEMKKQGLNDLYHWLSNKTKHITK